MALWGEDSKDADRPKHLNADEGVRSVDAAFQTERGWEVPLDGHNPELTDPATGRQLSEVIAAQSQPAQGSVGQAPNFYFPQAGFGSGITAQVGVPFEVFVRTADVDADVLTEDTVLTDQTSPTWATLQDFGNGVGRYSGTPTGAGIETFAVEADSDGDTLVRSFQVTVSA
jgi:hypothetical protein